MNRERKNAWNTHLVFFFILFVIFIRLAIFFAVDREERDIALAVVGFVLAAAPLLAIVISPVVYVFDCEKLTIVYCLGVKETIAWKDIRSITKRGGWFGKGQGLPVYEIAYPRRDKLPFFAQSCVVSNRRTARLIQEHYRKPIKEDWD